MTVCAAAVCAGLLAPMGHAADGPSVRVSKEQAGKGGTVTVTGKGWRGGALLTLLICGQNGIGGTNSCANAEGRAVTTDSGGGFSKEIPVAEPPKPCPCVVHVASVTGRAQSADAAFTVAGHPVAPLPREDGGGRLTVVDRPRLRGTSGLLTWFGAPPQRQLTFTVGNVGSTPAKDPLFQVGTSHGVFAPKWEEQQWRGSIPAGRKAEVSLPVELAAGAHGDYLVSLKYGGKLLVEQPWGVGRPWGVTLFWILLCIVVPAAVFRIGMAVVNKVRPREAAGARTKPAPIRAVSARASARAATARAASARAASVRAASARKKHRAGPRRPDTTPSTTDGGPARAPEPAAEDTAALPWFTPDTAPSTPTSTDRPTPKGPT